jgi:hypothetical protein
MVSAPAFCPLLLLLCGLRGASAWSPVARGGMGRPLELWVDRRGRTATEGTSHPGASRILVSLRSAVLRWLLDCIMKVTFGCTCPIHPLQRSGAALDERR